MTFVCPSSAHTSTLSGRSSAAKGTATITGVPAAGLPNSTSVVSRNCMPTWLASALWSITAKTFMPFADRMPVRRETVSVTDLELTLVVICVSVQSAMAGLLSRFVAWVSRPRAYDLGLRLASVI